MTQPEKLLTAEDVAEWLAVKRDTVYKWVRRGKLRCRYAGGAVRFRRADVEAFLGRVERGATNGNASGQSSTP